MVPSCPEASKLTCLLSNEQTELSPTWNTTGVQTISYPCPTPLKPLIRPPKNRFRNEVLRKYPFLADKHKLPDKENKDVLWDPDDPMLTTYKRDYGCTLQEFELIRSQGTQIPMPEQPQTRHPLKEYKPTRATYFTTEMKKFYSLPGGGWLLNRSSKPPPVKIEEPRKKLIIKPIKWESEYQANINGIAKCIIEKQMLTKKRCIVHRIPTLPDC